jgi:alcohol dehydrogenase YqhD (iron-dependent ADH family)
MKRIRNNDLTHYFFRDHSELPESYLKHCREFFESLGIKTASNKLQADKLQAASDKLQATSCKKILHSPGTRVKNRFNRKV